MLKEKDIKNELLEKVDSKEELDLEIVELEDKIAPRNWEVYALIQS